MKKINFLSVIVIMAMVLGSCGGIKKMAQIPEGVKYTVTPSPIEMHADEVEISLSGTYPEKYFNKKALMSVTPYLADADGNELVAFEPVTVQGEAVEGNNPVIAVAGGSLPSYNSKVPYDESYMKSELRIKCEVWVAGKEDAKLPFQVENKIADGVVATPALVQNTPRAILLPDKFERVTPETYAADIHYVVNTSNVRYTEMTSDDVKKMTSDISDAQENERKAIKGADISGFASWDGNLDDVNTPLSEKRAKSALQYLERELKKAKVEFDAEEFLKSESTPEDWAGFKKAMEESEVGDKDVILRVLTMYEDYEVREKEIKNIASAYPELKREILPKQRRSELVVNVEVTGYSDEELKELVDSDPDTLNVEEILFAATLFEDLDKKLGVYQKAAEMFPEDVRCINNVGYVLYAQGKAGEAKVAFDKAKEVFENEVVKNNCGVIKMVDGDMEGAEELFTAAMGAGDAVNYNLGIIAIKKAKYDDAVNHYGSMVDFNAALALILDGQPEGAMSTLKNIEEPDAMDYYLMAISAARQQQDELVFSNLRSAVQKDASLKDYAKKDLEFREFMANDTFKSIVQ